MTGIHFSLRRGSSLDMHLASSVLAGKFGLCPTHLLRMSERAVSQSSDVS